MRKNFIYFFILLFLYCFSIKKLPENNIKTQQDTINNNFDTTKINNFDSVKNYDSSKIKLDEYKYIIENTHLMSPMPNNINESSNFSSNKPKSSSSFSNKKNISKKNANNEPFVEVKEGKLIYSIPDTMKLGTIYTISIRIKKNINNIKIVDSLYKQKVVDIKVTNLVEVFVIDPSPTETKNFNILKQNSDKQLIEDDNYTEWVYSVQPLKSGNLKLNIIISIIKDDNLKQIVYFNSTYVKSNTAVVVKTFLEKYWQWLLSTIIIPFVVFIYKSRKNNEE